MDYYEADQPTPKQIKHVLYINQFTNEDLEKFCTVAALHEGLDTPFFAVTDIPKGVVEFPHGWISHHGKWIPSCTRDKVLTNLFYEASTRTSSSFYSAMVRIGGHVIQINDVNYSSVSKGETLEDTIRTLQCYSHAIVLRHSEVGAARRAAMVSEVPIINAGDGVGEHPTQALLDFYTILMERGWTLYNSMKIKDVFDGLTVTMMGDLKHGRTVKSLATLLKRYNVRINWVSPEALKIPPEFLSDNDKETTKLDDVIKETDVLYVTRTQFERFANAGFPLDTISYEVTKDHMDVAKSNMVLMHPLPRNSEIPTALDSDPRSAYFRQMKHGLYMRMAVLQHVLEK